MKNLIIGMTLLTSLNCLADQKIKVSIVQQTVDGSYLVCEGADPIVAVDDANYRKDIRITNGSFELQISDNAKKLMVQDAAQDKSGCTDYIVETKSGTKHIQVLGIRIKL